MKKTILTTIILIAFIIEANGQGECNITDHYEEFISIQKTSYNDNEYLVKKVKKTTQQNCFSELVNHNPTFFDYLLTNFSSNENYPHLIQMSDSIALRNSYFIDLKSDSLFNAVMTDLVNKSIDKNIPKDTVSMDILLNIAVKYFSILRLNEDGHYVGKVCVGLNDIKKTETERKPFLEAFSFTSILKHYNGEEFNMYEEFVKAIKELYKVNLGIDKDEKLLRAQGAMFLLMRNSENLQMMLKTEYESNKEVLPFILEIK